MVTMRHAVARPGRTALMLAAAAVLLGCASAPPPPAPAQIPALEARLARDSSDIDAMVQLGAAYRQAGRSAEARWLLERALARRPDNALTALYLGLTYEDQGDLGRARELYTRYVEAEAAPGMRDVQRRIRARLPLLARRELEAAVRSAIAREAELAGTEPAASRVAVFPFLYGGADPELRPLGRALAELLATDLSQVQRVTVLERARVQLLLDELALADSGYVDPATAARSGRLLGAGRIVQGRIAGGADALRLEAAVVRAGTGEAVGGAVREEDELRRLFDMEKRLALALFESLGVQLTPAERERVNRRPTQSLQALLEYGLGLEAEDAGDYARAAAHYGRAEAADPGFAEARTRREGAEGAAAAVRETTAQLSALASAAAGFGAAAPASIEIDQVLQQLPAFNGRDAAAEILGREGIGRRSVIEIILRPPTVRQ